LFRSLEKNRDQLRIFHHAAPVGTLLAIRLTDLSAQDANTLLNSYEKAAIEDPVAVTPLHEPRSAWQIWADEVLKNPAYPLDPAVKEVAELIAAS
jgi:hypothetical protein